MAEEVLAAADARPDAGIHLFDEGLLQALWSIALEGHAGTVRQLGSLLVPITPPVDVVAVLEADAGAVTRRLIRRPGRESRVDCWALEEPNALARACELMDEVVGFLAEMSGLPSGPRVIRSANGAAGDSEATARQLAAEIERS